MTQKYSNTVLLPQVGERAEDCPGLGPEKPLDPKDDTRQDCGIHHKECVKLKALVVKRPFIKWSFKKI